MRPSRRRFAADSVAARQVPFKAALAQADAQARVTAALPVRATPSSSKAMAEATRFEISPREGPDALGRAERLRLLSSPSALALLRVEMAAHRAHPG